MPLNDSMKLELVRAEITYEELLRNGGMRQVHKVRRRNKPYALVDMSKNNRRVFRERDILRAVTGEHVVALIEPIITAHPGEYAFLFEFCQFGNLNDVFAREGIDRFQTLRYAFIGDMVASLTFIHRKGVAHRQIRPSKFMVTMSRSEQICLKLGDFSQSCFVGLQDENDDEGFDEQEQDGNSFLPPPFEAGNQIADHLTAADVFSLAATMYSIYQNETRNGKLVAMFNGKPLRESDEVALGQHLRRLMSEDRCVEIIVAEGLVKNEAARISAKNMLYEIQQGRPRQEGTYRPQREQEGFLYSIFRSIFRFLGFRK